MSLLNINQSELITLKEKAEKILKELQMNCDFDYENYHEALEQLNAIDGWTESQSTDGGYAEGHDWYSTQEKRVEEMKARLDRSKAESFTLETFLGLVFETDCIVKLEADILPPEVVSEMCSTYNVNHFPSMHSYYSVEEMLSGCISPETNTWQAREILALLKSLRAHRLVYDIRHTLKHPTCDGRVNTFNMHCIVHKLCELQYLEYLEEVVTLGMLDLELSGNFKAEVKYMVNHDFSKDFGIDFRKLRYAKAEEIKLNANFEFLDSIMPLVFETNYDNAMLFSIALIASTLLTPVLITSLHKLVVTLLGVIVNE